MTIKIILRDWDISNRCKALNRLLLFFFMIAMSFKSSEDKIRAGCICIVENGDGKFGVVKILVINHKTAHIKIYKNVYTTRPSKIDLKTLTTGSMYDKDGSGIGHVPLERKVFNSWKPIVIGFEKVTKDDLEGYELWRSQ